MTIKESAKPAVSPLEIAAGLADFWSPQVIEELDDSYVKVAKLKGDLTWHNHADEDELFLILQGTLIIEYEDSQVVLKTGDLHVVPKSTQHNPIAHDECLVMLIERKNTLHTGTVHVEKTRDIEQQVGDFHTQQAKTAES
jgi:mannose-6-phosphate isomerase-like protein (cupin superfamily)